MVKGLVFDLDGTLVSLKIDAPRLKGAMIEELSRQGFDVSALDTSMFTQTIMDFAKSEVEAGRVNKRFDSIQSGVYAVLDRLELEWNAGSAPIVGAAEALSQLRKSSVGLAVVTNSGRVAAQYLFEKYNLSPYFDCILTRDDVSLMKPHPEGILKAIGALGLGREDVFYVGDSPIDIRAARAAGVKAVAVLSGSSSPERLRTEAPDFLIGSISELHGLLETD